MSSSTEITVTPTYKVTTRHGFDGVEALDLTGMLGTGGCRLMGAALEGLASSPATRWQCVADGREKTFQLDLREGLPGGVGNVSVAVRLRAGSAEVSRRWTYLTTEIRSSAEASQVPAAVAEAVRKCVNRTVNGVLMQTLANELQTRVEQRAQAQHRNRIQQSVQIHQRAANQIQLVARMRAGGGR